MALRVCIPRCADGSYHVGSTKQDVEARVWEHNEGVVRTAYTYTWRPVILVYCEEYDRLIDGFARERQLRGWSRQRRKR